MRTQIRQGDVLLVPVEKPEGQVTRACDENGAPLQGLRVDGERTGHAHVLPARVYDTDAGRVLFLERPAMLTHEEHADVEIPAGWWSPIQQREYVPQSRPRNRSWAD